jgi:hypothetical protein
MGLYYKALRLRNVRQIVRRHNMLVPSFIIDHKHTNYCHKQTSLLRNQYITNPLCFIVHSLYLQKVQK